MRTSTRTHKKGGSKVNTFEAPEIQLVALTVSDVALGSNEFDIVPFSDENNLGIVKLS